MIFDIDWNPIIFSIGTLEIRWYGVMVVLAVITVIGFSLLEAKRKGFSPDMVWDVGLWAVIGGIIGARLLHIIDKWQLYLDHPEQLLNFAGLAIWGAVLGGLAAILIYCLIKKLSFWQLGDIAAPGAILGQAIGRVAAWLTAAAMDLPASFPSPLFTRTPAAMPRTEYPCTPLNSFTSPGTWAASLFYGRCARNSGRMVLCSLPG